MKHQSNSVQLQWWPSIPRSIALLAAAVLIPFLIHLIPHQGATTLGAIWIPLFYVPLLALLVFRFREAFLVGILAPYINFLILGMPEISIVMMLAGEVALFLVAVSILLPHRYLRWVAAPIAFVVIKFVSAQFAPILPFAMAPGEFWLNAISHAVPGILMLTAINILVLKLWKKPS